MLQSQDQAPVARAEKKESRRQTGMSGFMVTDCLMLWGSFSPPALWRRGPELCHLNTMGSIPPSPKARKRGSLVWPGRKGIPCLGRQFESDRCDSSAHYGTLFTPIMLIVALLCRHSFILHRPPQTHTPTREGTGVSVSCMFLPDLVQSPWGGHPCP